MSKEQAMFGFDVHPEYQRGLNFERARAEGYEFCIIKAAEGPYRDGSKYVPTGFKDFFRRAEAEGFVMGVYDFLLSTPAKAQADHFLRTIEAVGGPEDKVLMVDFEAHPNPALTPGNDQLKTFISEVKRRVGDHPIVVYSGRGFWNGGDPSGDFAQYGADVAWDAYYLHMDPVHPKRFYANSERSFQDAGLPWGWGKPWGGVEPWFWQFTSAGSVAGMNIDVNAYRGTLEELLALTGVKEGGGTGDGGAGDRGKRDEKVRREGRDDETDGSEAIEQYGEELEEIDLEEIGRKTVRFFSIMSRSIRESKTLRRDSEAPNGEVEDY
jgi:GH25 family lysozyme M1 (1,4-beta-N-acetylmuramidase)